jgi:Pyridoxamine 5'-phosphate oxidase
MASWSEIQRDAPEFADRVLARFEAGANKTLATLRRDGAPRISATEAQFTDGQVCLGMIPGSAKLHDVRRDPRVALHSPTMDAPDSRPEDQPGDAKLAGVVVEAGTEPDLVLFQLDIAEAALIYLDGGELIIESWHPGRSHQRRSRII